MVKKARLYFLLLVLLALPLCMSNPPADDGAGAGLSSSLPLTVILTFDFETDECAENIPNILSTLEAHNAKATFFVTGKMAEKHPETLIEISKAGHGIGSHGYNHEYPIFRKKDALLFSVLFQKSFDYEWARSAKTTENYRFALERSIQAITNAVGRPPRSYRSPMLAPTYSRDMTYLSVVEDAGFVIDSSINRRYMTQAMAEQAEQRDKIKVVPASFSDSDIGDMSFVMKLVNEHYEQGQPLVIFFHPWRFSEKEHFQNFQTLLSEIEKNYENTRYMSIEEYADSA